MATERVIFAGFGGQGVMSMGQLLNICRNVRRKRSFMVTIIWSRNAWRNS